MKGLRRTAFDDCQHDCRSCSGRRREGVTLVELLWCVLLIAPTWAGFVAAKGHGALARIVGFVVGAVVGIAGLFASMLLVSVLLKVIGPGVEGTTDIGPGREGWRQKTDRIAAVVLLLTLLSMPLWAAWGSGSLVRWIYRP